MSRTDIRLLLEIARWAFRYTWRFHKNLLLAIILVTVLLGLVPAGLAATGLATPTLAGNGQILLSLERLHLIPGDYFVDVGIYEHNWAYDYDYHWHVYPLTVTGNTLEKGVLRPPHRWELRMP